MSEMTIPAKIHGYEHQWKLAKRLQRKAKLGKEPALYHLLHFCVAHTLADYAESTELTEDVAAYIEQAKAKGQRAARLKAYKG